MPQGARETLELVGRLERRVNQNQPAPLRRRQRCFHRVIAVRLTHFDRAVAGKLALELQRIFRMKLAGDQPVARSQRGSDKTRRSGIVA